MKPDCQDGPGRWRHKLRHDRSWQGLLVLVVLGGLLRVCYAWQCLTLIYPDEQFQSLEPASWVVYGIGIRSWEWLEGARNWLVPALYMPLLAVVRWLGVPMGETVIAACRVLTAIASGFSLWFFACLLREARVGRVTLMTAVTSLVLSPVMIMWGGASFSESWVMIFLWCLLPSMLGVALDKAAQPRALLGLGLGLSFFVMLRYAMLFWVLPFGLLWLLWQKPDRRQVLAMLGGGLLGLILMGGLDALTWGEWFRSLRVYVQANLVYGLADLHGVSPWYAYGDMLWQQFSPWWMVPLLVLGLVAAWQPGRLSRRDGFILLPSLVFGLVHCGIGHKEMRFLLPIFPALFYVAALGWDRLGVKVQERWPRDRRQTQWLGIWSFVVLAITTAPWSLKQAQAPARFFPGDMTAVANLLVKDEAWSLHPEACLLIYGGSVYWLRGEMQLGRVVAIKELAWHDLQESSPALSECAYALVFRQGSELFAAQARERWRLRRMAPTGDAYYLRADVAASVKSASGNVQAAGGS